MYTGSFDNQLMLRNARVWLGEDHITRYVALPGAEVTLEDAREIHEAVVRLYGGQSHPLLVDIREVKSASREARSFFASTTAAATTCAVALLIASPVSRVVGNFFLNIHKPVFPTRLFTSEEEGLDWLREFVQ